MHDTLLPPPAETVREMAERALGAMPAPFRDLCKGIAILVEEFPDDGLLAEMKIETGWDLTGVYEGTPLTEKSVSDTQTAPDTVRLFRLPILFEWIERGDVTLEDLVAHVLVHELAHHFGWSDEDIAEVDRWWE